MSERAYSLAQRGEGCGLAVRAEAPQQLGGAVLVTAAVAGEWARAGPATGRRSVLAHATAAGQRLEPGVAEPLRAMPELGPVARVAGGPRRLLMQVGSPWSRVVKENSQPRGWRSRCRAAFTARSAATAARAELRAAAVAARSPGGELGWRCACCQRGLLIGAKAGASAGAYARELPCRGSCRGPVCPTRTTLARRGMAAAARGGGSGGGEHWVAALRAFALARTVRPVQPVGKAVSHHCP